MENNYNMPQLMEKLTKSSRKQAVFSGLQCFFTFVTAICMAIILLTILQFVPQVDSLMQRADFILDDLEEATDQLNELELPGLIENVDTLVSTGQTGVEDAMEKINSIDTDELNRAIADFGSVVKDLSQIIEPLKKVAGLFS